MGDVVNLRQARKHKVRAGKDAQAARNRAAFGRSKADRELDAARGQKAARELDGAKRDKPEP